MEEPIRDSEDASDEHLAKNKIADHEGVFTSDEKPLQERANTPRGAASELGRAQDNSNNPPPS